MLKIFINSGQGEVDFTRYVRMSTDGGEGINIQQSLNTPTVCQLSMSNYDGGFSLPPVHSYIRIWSTLYNRNLFTGFLSVAPTVNYLALHAGAISQQNPSGQLFKYDFTFTSDEYILQLKSIEFLPAFVNQTQGQILQQLAETLCPGFFDYSNIASGQLVPYLEYDPTKSWSEYAKEFGDASRYRYRCINKQIHFQPYNDGYLGVEYDESGGSGTFDAQSLEISALATPMVNDVIIVGAQEPGNNHEDYFMGDGFTGTFPLRHQVYNAGGQGGQSQGTSGSIVLSDDWNESAFNTNVWNVQDPTNAFSLIDGALQVVSPYQTALGLSYIRANNGLELAGGQVLQHGEFNFNDTCLGILGGVYDDATLNPATCEAGFQITPTASVVVTASGASGISIQPFRQGAVPSQAFDIITKVNKTYVLTTIISAPSPVRYSQVYTTLGGVVYGGEALSSAVSGSITWQVQETDKFTGVVNTYTFALAGLTLPSFGIYALINNQQLNISVSATTVYAPPLGSMYVASKIGAGLLAPIYISGNQQYTGAYVTPSGGNLPILPGDLGVEQQWPLGSSLQNQSAEIDLGSTFSSLAFYSNDLPGVGTRIRLQTWESQAAIARLENPYSVASEAALVGDDGHRLSIVTDMNPQPRSSEDCDVAAQAYLADHVSTYWQGTYNASYAFFKQYTNDLEFYPCCGRYLYINAPQRGLSKTNVVVTAITTTITELMGEIMTHSLSFGPDLHVEKILPNFVSFPANILLPQDTTVQLTPQQLAAAGIISSYLPDVQMSKFDTLSISGSGATLVLQDAIPSGAFYEVRNSDFGWGTVNSGLIGRYYANGNQLITRNANGFEQVWYMRFCNPTGGISGGLALSRRSKVLRLYWPQTPSVPAFLYADSTAINVDFNGDIRNINGIELRAGPNSGLSLTFAVASVQVINKGIIIRLPVPHGTGKYYTIVTFATELPGVIAGASGVQVQFSGLTNYTALNNQTLTMLTESQAAAVGLILANNQAAFAFGSDLYGPAVDTGIMTSDISTAVFYDGVVGSEFDMQLNLQTLRGELQPGSSVVGGPVGSYMIGTVPKTLRSFTVYFFNLMWEYSPGLNVYIAPPDTPNISIGYRWGSALQINVASTLRTDIKYTTLQLASINTILFPSYRPSFTFPVTASAEQTGVGNTTNISSAIHGFQSFILPGSGTIFVQWNGRGTLFSQPPLGRSSTYSIQFQTSIDGGVTWQTAASITPPGIPVGNQNNTYPASYISFPLPSGSYNFSQLQLRVLCYAQGADTIQGASAYASVTDAYVTFTVDPFAAAVPSGSFNNVGTVGAFYQAQTQGAVASFNVNVTVTGDVYARVKFTDYIGDGSWSPVLKIPQGNLIASDYLSAQGSVPPAITNINGTSGGIFTYSVTATGIQMFSQAFQVLYPNGSIDTIAAASGAFFGTIDDGALTPLTLYGFFPAVKQPTTPNPYVTFDGPWLNYNSTNPTIQALQAQFSDGSVPLVNGPFVVQTASAGGSGGGGGGGTRGGGNCASVDAYLLMADGSRKKLRDVNVGDKIATPSGRGSKLKRKETFSEPGVEIVTESGLTLQAALGHVVRNTASGEWVTLEDALTEENDAMYVWALRNKADAIARFETKESIEICRIELEGPEHVYAVNDIWSHNVVKSE